MRLVNFGVAETEVTLVSDSSYAPVVYNLIAGARHICFCNLFIVDTCPRNDIDLKIYSLLLELAGATWRGVDVRLLVGGSRANLDMAIAAELARATARELKIPCRWLTAQRTRASHAKWVVVDGWVLLGSHNWSSGAFTDQTQDSVLLYSPALAAYLSSQFETVWQRAGEGGENVPV